MAGRADICIGDAEVVGVIDAEGLVAVVGTLRAGAAIAAPQQIIDAKTKPWLARAAVRINMRISLP